MSDQTLCFSYNCKSPPIPDVVEALQVRPVEPQAVSVETAPVPQIEVAIESSEQIDQVQEVDQVSNDAEDKAIYEEEDFGTLTEEEHANLPDDIKAIIAGIRESDQAYIPLF